MMKNMNSLIRMTLFLIIAFGIGFWAMQKLVEFRLRKQQEQLATKLGVQIQDYPYPDSFPSGYMLKHLEIGMSINQVHHIVQGFQEIFHCEGDFNDETYYFFGANQRNSIIIIISYDELKRYESIHVSNPNYPIFGGQDCVPGPLTE